LAVHQNRICVCVVVGFRCESRAHALIYVKCFAVSKSLTTFAAINSFTNQNLAKMKKVIMMVAMMAIPFAMQAQTKFHDVEANEAQGKVKSITTSTMGTPRTINFSEDGKMIPSAEVAEAVYDADGYIQSAKVSMQGQSTEVKYTWENGRLKGQTLNVMGNDLKVNNIYDDKGVITGQSIDMGGQVMEMPYTDIKNDAQGNWISRKTSMMGQEVEQTRTIEYYE